jgi:nucleotide-binding universal stress UspA family protein
MPGAVLDRPPPTTTDDALDKQPVYQLQRIDEDLLADLRTLAEFHRVKVPVIINELLRPIVDAKLEEMAAEITRRAQAARGHRPDQPPERPHRRPRP